MSLYARLRTRQTWARWSEPESDLQAFIGSRRGFEEWVYGWWSGGLDHLDVLWFRCRQETGVFHDHHQRRALRVGDHTFEALRELQARALRTSAEIASLLRSGHGEAAFARWRTLHEIAVVMEFLIGEDRGISSRYMAYATSVPESLHLAEAADELQRKRTVPPELRAELVKRYGERFFEEYGWALPAFPEKLQIRPGKKKPPRVQFADLEARVEQSERRIHYGLASQQIHAGPFALASGIRVSPSGRPTLLTEPLGGDLLAAGVRTSETLLLATLCFLALRSDTRSVGARTLLNRLAAEAWRRSHDSFVAEYASQAGRDFVRRWP